MMTSFQVHNVHDRIIVRGGLLYLVRETRTYHWQASLVGANESESNALRAIVMQNIRLTYSTPTC